MNSDRLLIFGIPALVAVLVHLLFVFALEGGWTTASPSITAQPQVVQASLVSLSKPKPKPKPKPKAVEPKPEPKPAPAPASQVESPPLEPIAEPSESAPEVSQAERLAELQRELMAGFEDLPDADDQQPSEEVDEVQQVAGLMQARITQNWRRPPSARNGMEVLLIISLVPTGEVVGISVSSSREVRHLIAVRSPPLSAWRASPRSQSCLFPISSDTFDAFPYDSSQKI